ncbi:MAG: dihydrofolate reductase family protein [Chromatiales bacterium]|nr:dihydrofolate reductase family protein [Chromatiales bacterium]
MNTIQLYPEHKEYPQLRGIYLEDPLLSDNGAAIVYSNFLTSLDGRIAISKNNRLTLPPQLTCDTDLRLFLELQAHADCLLIHGGYLRSLASGRLGDILRVGQPKKYADLADWRRQRGLSVQPLVVICSNTLDFVIPDGLDLQDVWIATSRSGDAERIGMWKKRGYKVVFAGERRVEGGKLTAQLIKHGYRRLYLCAGPELFESCLNDGCLSLHYMTISMQFIGQPEFLTMLCGYTKLMDYRLKLSRLILNQEDSEDHEAHPDQLYLTFQVSYDKPTLSR